MNTGGIPDEQIPTTAPEEVVKQYLPWVKKIAYRYNPIILDRTGAIDVDDLIQAGSVALLRAQEKYDPAGGASFLTFSAYYIKSAIRREIGFSSDGKLPQALDYLDKPISEDGDTSLIDMIPDTAPTAEENTVTQDATQETVDAVRAAVDRLKSPKQREVIRRVYLDGQGRAEAAADMEMNVTALRALDMEARHKLKRDRILQQYAMPFFHVGPNRFRSTWTSAVEMAILWKEEHLSNLLPAMEEPHDSFGPERDYRIP